LQTACTSKIGGCLQNAPFKTSIIKASQRGLPQEALALRGFVSLLKKTKQKKNLPNLFEILQVLFYVISQASTRPDRAS
jgi:hypothetical protein